ncbi:flagellar basal body-associated protein FliL [Aliishimia ponticola]|uniref:Flagellar basal body-associated protein FliL n=1 Tax=Aliishimia ponticola TaxID=2499833 RepID=A0A4S4N9X9_9RHOB|nr:flagellar basal body-associated protein FliL [Aliishimia ponticola]
MKKILPILLLLIGTGAGVGAGVFLRPAPEPVEAAEGGEAAEDGEHGAQEAKADDGDSAEDGEAGEEREYVKMSNQFVIPLVEEGEVTSLVMMALSVEVDAGFRDSIFLKEPKLRDSFLQVMFDHANIGGFRGAFTDNDNLDVLRSALREVAVRDAGDHVTDILILEIARQDY